MTDLDRWPLSAASTAVLLVPKTSAKDIFKLALKELVVTGVWALSRITVQRRLRGPEEVALLQPGGVTVPDQPPLPYLSAALWASSPQGGLLRDVVLQQLGGADSCRQQAREELQQRGLLQVTERWYGDKLTRTPTGDSWAATVRERQDRWTEALTTGGPAAAAVVAEGIGSPGLVLLLDRTVLAAIDAELTRRADRDGGYVPAVGGSSDEGGMRLGDLDGIDGLSGLDGAVDGAVDGGSSGGGGDGSGGDGGGGDGGGGGGGD